MDGLDRFCQILWRRPLYCATRITSIRKDACDFYVQQTKYQF